MSTQRARRRLPWGSLAVAVLCFALGLAMLILVNPIDTSRAGLSPVPGRVALPPTAAPLTPTSTTTSTTTSTPTP